MAVYLTQNEKELIITCKCGCSGIQFKIDPEDDDYCMMEHLNNSFYTEQYGASRRFIEKCKRIWRIIRNKDFCYSDIIITKQDFDIFKEYINKF